MDKKMMDLLLELLKDSKRSDRELAKVLDVSQPTITRMRNRLVKEGVIREFTIIPDFIKLGYEIMAIIAVQIRVTKENRAELVEKAMKAAQERPSIIFLARAEGMGKNGVIISLHKNYVDFSDFISDLMAEQGELIESYDTLLVSLGARIIKPFSLKYLAELEKT